MKKIILISLFSVVLFAKPTILMITQDNCSYCEKQKKVIENSVLKNYIQKNFEYKELNMGRRLISPKFKTDVTPTIFIIDEKEKIRKKLIGYQNNRNLLLELNETLKDIYK